MQDYKPGETKEKIINFFRGYPQVTCRKGGVILRPDDPVFSIYYVTGGYIRMYLDLADGKELTVSIFKPGAYFPAFLAVGGLPNSYYYQAITAVQAQKAPKDAVLRFMAREPDVMAEFTRRLAAGFNGFITSLQYFLFGTAQSRVAAVILYLAKRFGVADNEGRVTIPVPLTHQDIASIAGLTRETTSLELEKLGARKILQHGRNGIVIYNTEGLEQLSPGDSAEETRESEI
jgi:CRP/FNR family cyclic AMP-dependent transcriptional regulator